MSETDDTLYTSFLGRGWSFPPTFSKTKKDVEMTADEEDIRRSLEILLSTSPGERFLQPKYGCSLDALLFEPLTTTMKTYVTGIIKQALLLFEPRIELHDVSLNGSEDAAGRVDIVIDYTVRTTNSRYNLVYPFYRQEGSRK
jgi:phage baseplate assembly protein W